MPAPPPPPPPGPPPPPSFGGGASKSGGADGRGLLLQSIRQGTTLKKTVTSDRSGPQISGKLGNSAKSSNTNTSSNVRPSNSSSDAFRNNGLGGLFAGGMPKLKPTGRLGSNISPQTPDQVRHVPNSSSLHSESILQRQDSDSRSFPSDVRNRGPPPQPPPSTQKPSMPTSASDSILQTSITRFNSNTSPASGPPSLPSKPPVANFGKPNLAPKPPGKPSPPPKKMVMNGGRPTVTRAQSMRVPRSPPVAPPSVIFPPSSKELGSYQRNTAFHQSQDSIHQYRPNPPPPPRTATLPSNLHHHGFKSMAPLPPPSTPPPPAPTGQQMRPLNRPLRPRLGAPLCPPPPPPTSAPPPPPHRTSPAPAPPSMQTRLAPAVPSSAPPPPPVRNSSMRNGSSSGCSDIETRFAHMFHPVHEFPNPPTFRGITKIYNSKTAALKHHATNTGKQQAPPPPPVLQISNKMWANETSTC